MRLLLHTSRQQQQILLLSEDLAVSAAAAAGALIHPSSPSHDFRTLKKSFLGNVAQIAAAAAGRGCRGTSEFTSHSIQLDQGYQTCSFGF